MMGYPDHDDLINLWNRAIKTQIEIDRGEVSASSMINHLTDLTDLKDGLEADYDEIRVAVMAAAKHRESQRNAA